MPISMLYLFEEGSLWEMNYPLVEQTIRPNITGHLKIKYAVTNCIFDIVDIALDMAIWKIKDVYCNCEIWNINVSMEAIAS